ARGVLRQALAHVAVTAAGERLRLVAEVAEQRVVATAAALSPAQQLEKEAPLVLEQLRRRRCAIAELQQTPSPRRVLRGDEQEAVRGRTVAAGPPDLLVVRLDRARGGATGAGAHVRPIDPHAEGVRRDHP